MPAPTGTLLTAEERLGFGAWLAGCVERSGFSKKAISRDALGHDSTQWLNRYLNGQVPTLPVLKKLASELGVFPMIALWRAGYFRELLGAIEELVEGANEDANFLAVLFAVRAFPSPNCAPTPIFGEAEAMLGSMYFTPRELGASPVSLIDLDRLGKRPLHRLLELAANALSQTDIDAHTRREVAGVYANAWADKVNPELAVRLRGEFADDALHEFRTTTGKSTVNRFYGSSRAAFAPFMAPSHKVTMYFQNDPRGDEKS